MENVDPLEEAGVTGDPFDFDSCLDDLIGLASTDSSTTTQGGTTNKKKLHRQSSVSRTLKNELEKYCSLPLESRDMDPILWWKTNLNLFPGLGKVANKMLSSPPSQL